MRIVNDLGRVIDDYAADRLVHILIAIPSLERKATDPRDKFTPNPLSRLPLGPAPNYRINSEQLFGKQT